MVDFDLLHTNASQWYLTNGMCNSLFLMDEGLLSIISAGCGQLVKMLIPLEPDGMITFTFFLKLAGIMPKKRKKNIEKNNFGHTWIRITAPGCWIARKPP